MDHQSKHALQSCVSSFGVCAHLRWREWSALTAFTCLPGPHMSVCSVCVDLTTLRPVHHTFALHFFKIHFNSAFLSTLTSHHCYLIILSNTEMSVVAVTEIFCAITVPHVKWWQLCNLSVTRFRLFNNIDVKPRHWIQCCVIYTPFLTAYFSKIRCSIFLLASQSKICVCSLPVPF